MPKISALPPMTTAADDDEAPIVDKSVTTTKKWTLTLLKNYLQSLVAWISPAMWTNPYKFSAYCSTGKSITNTSLIVDLQTELFDTNNNFVNSRYTAPVAGFYQVNAQTWMGSAGMGTNEYGNIQIRKNGATIFESERMNGSGDSMRLVRPNLSCIMQLAAGDYIEMWAVFTGSRDIVAGQPNTFFNGFLVSQT